MPTALNDMDPTHDPQAIAEVPPERQLSLEAAIAEIKRTHEQSTDIPYCLLVGAGISDPPISTAAALIDVFKGDILKATPDIALVDPPSASRADLYSYWFDRAYPSDVAKQAFFARIVEKTPLSAANHRLAHLLMANNGSEGRQRLFNLIVTPNFDDYLSRALALFGCNPAPLVCDHPAATKRISVRSHNIQILHLHGTYQFYDLKHSPEDISNSEMCQKLDQIVSEFVPIVVGYSCWNDAFWQAFEKRLWNGTKPNPLGRKCYWFCFRRSALNELPERLRQHPEVCFVLPPADAPPHPRTSEGSGAVWYGAPGFSQKASDPSTLPATQVFDAFINMLGLNEPDLTRDPIAFLIRHLDYALPDEKQYHTEPKQYFIARLQRQLREIGNEWCAEMIPGSNEVFTAMRSSRHRDAILKTSLIWIELTKDNEALMKLLFDQKGVKLRAPLRDLLDAAWSASVNLPAGDEAELEAMGHNLVCQLGDLIEKYLGSMKPSTDGSSTFADDDEMYAQAAMSSLFLAIRRINTEKEVLVLKDLAEVQRKFSYDPSSAVALVLAWAKLNEGAVHHRGGDHNAALECYRECERMCDSLKDVKLGCEPILFAKYNMSLMTRMAEEKPGLLQAIGSYVVKPESRLNHEIAAIKAAIGSCDIKVDPQDVQQTPSG